MEKDKLNEIEKKIKELEDEKRKLEEQELKKELKPSIKGTFKDMLNSEDEEIPVETIFNEYSIPDEKTAKLVVSDIQKLTKISNYSLLLGGVSALIIYLVLGENEAFSFVLGVFTSLFSYSMLIKDTKNLAYVHISKYKSLMVKSNIKRMFVYAAVLFFVYVFQDSRDLILLYTFIGMLTVKITTFIYFIINKGGIK